MQLQTSSIASSQNLEPVGLVWKSQPMYFADSLPLLYFSDFLDR